jgi:hypothetical protein
VATRGGDANPPLIWSLWGKPRKAAGRDQAADAVIAGDHAREHAFVTTAGSRAPALHQTVCSEIEIPVFVFAGTEPVERVVVPLIGKANGDPVLRERPL